MRHVFHPEAQIEYRQAALYYEKRQVGLGARFSEDIEATIRRLASNPGQWRILEEDIRRCLADVFPYGVLYTIENDYVLIIAIMHLSREPGYWKDRVETG